MLRRVYFYHKIYEYFRKKVIKKISNVISISQGDMDLSRKWYNSTAILHHCFGYPSNCYKESLHLATSSSNNTVILVGNSADPSNNHLDAFSLIAKFLNKDIKVVTPLSYGDKRYAKKIMKEGEKIFGNQYVAINKLLPFDSYLNLLAEVDIGIFPHNRQQAMGSIITLLGMKKKVYMRNDITTWGTLADLGIKLYDLNDFNLSEPNQEVLEDNSEIIKNYFSEKNLLRQWLKIFDHRP